MVVHLVHHFGLGLTDSHNLSYSTIGCERGQRRERFGGVIAVNFLAGSYTDCPTVTTTLLTPLHPGLITLIPPNYPSLTANNPSLPWKTQTHTTVCPSHSNMFGAADNPCWGGWGLVQCDSEVVVAKAVTSTAALHSTVDSITDHCTDLIWT